MSKDNQIKLLKKARAKYFSNRLAIALRNFNRTSTLRQSYLNTIYCNKVLVYDEEESKLKGKYCKNRWCLLCNRIRTAHLINAYGKELDKLEDRYFVTLTAPTCLSSYLRHRIKEFEDEWRRILENNRMKSKRKKQSFDTFRGIRKMECTIRPQNYYHYHYHVIIEGKAQAEWLMSQWLKRFPKAKEHAQNIRLADCQGIKELFKYFTKLTAKDEGLFKTEKRYIGEFKRLDFLFRMLKGKRVFQPFGGLKKVSEELTNELIQDITRPEGFEGKLWRWVINDWESELNEVLTNYIPSDTTEELLSKCPSEI